MAVSLKRALMEILTDWPDDRPSEGRDACGEAEFGFGNADPQLEREFWEPVFPVRRGRNFPGMPVGAHMLRAFEGVPPHHVRCVILGQNPYPAPDFDTGRAFEAGNVVSWRELDKVFSEDKVFSKSVRALHPADRRGADGRFRLRTKLCRSAEDARRDRERRGRVRAHFEAILGQDVMIMNPARFSPVVAMARA
jgi:hypothetical protein